MSLYDYRQSLEISKHDPQFAALIMAAMRKADTTNVALLRWAWPDIWREFELRYHSPGGIVPGDGVSSPLPGGSGPCSICQTETTYASEYTGAWLCPDHGGKP